MMKGTLLAPQRWSTPLATLAVLVAALLACKKEAATEEKPGASATATVAAAPALLSKPLASLTKDDLSPLCEKLGWSSSGTTWSSSGNFASIMTSCSKEDPTGTDSPDGKKRARLTIAHFKTDAMPAKLKDLDDKAAAYAYAGEYVLAVYLHTQSKPDAQKVLEQILGPEGAKQATAGAGATADTTGAAPSATAAAPAGAFKVGDAVDVEWKGEWWKAEVKKVIDGPQYYIHYVGWEASWDEWVKPSRIRARTAGSRSN